MKNRPPATSLRKQNISHGAPRVAVWNRRTRKLDSTGWPRCPLCSFLAVDGAVEKLRRLIAKRCKEDGLDLLVHPPTIVAPLPAITEGVVTVPSATGKRRERVSTAVLRDGLLLLVARIQRAHPAHGQAESADFAPKELRKLSAVGARRIRIAIRWLYGNAIEPHDLVRRYYIPCPDHASVFDRTWGAYRTERGAPHVKFFSAFPDEIDDSPSRKRGQRRRARPFDDDKEVE